MNSKLKEALENSNGLLEELALLGEWHESAREQIEENKAALAEPPRNCDVGTAEEQLKRFKDFCSIISKDETCDGCLLLTQSSRLGHCVLDWTQMPYKKGETK